MVRDQAKPRKLGRYELEECLGIEGAIETYRARVRGLAGFDRIFAVKCLRRGRGGPVNLTDPFVKTAKRTASINDPRVARVLDADVIDGVAIAVTEFVHGLDLDRFREWAHVSGVLATGVDATAEKWQKIVAYVGAEAAGGLAAIHGLSPPLVHGGLCPRNIIATARGGIKLLDVGLRQSAQNPDEPPSPRALAYAAPDPATEEPSAPSDMRSLGVVMFELVTGELPPIGAGSLAARKILDALWPSMADFIAGLLAEDATLRPTATEAAKILGDFWSEIPDASMVAEMALMVRNFSSFVADSNSPHTPPPVSVEPTPEVPPPVARTQIPSDLSPPAPHAPSASGSFLGLGDVPTRVMPSGSYVNALFQAVPTDPSLPNFADELAVPDQALEALVAMDSEADLETAMEISPAIESPTLVEPEVEKAIALSPATGATMGDVQGGATSVDSVPIPELAEWGAQALAALGDQAGVAIAPLPPAPEPTIEAVDAFETNEVAPPPVDDPVIEEAFAFMPPPPLREMAQAPVAQAVVDVRGSQLKHTLLMTSAQPPLEDELIDDPHEPEAIMVNAFELQEASLEVLTGDPGEAGIAPVNDEAGERPPFEAAALVSSEEETSSAEWTPPRLAHAMPAPEADEIRGPKTRTARRSGTDATTGGQDDEDLKRRPSRVRRVAIAIGIIAGLGGAIAAALVTMGPGAKGAARLAPPVQPVRQPKKIAQTNPTAAPAMQVGSATPPAPAPAPSAASDSNASPVAAFPTVTVPAAMASKPAGGSSSISLPVVSKPDGATVWIDGEERGKTPCTVKLKSGRAHLVLVHPGYLTSPMSLDVRDGSKIDVTLVAVEPPMGGDARFRAECKTQGKFPIVVDGKETGILCPYSKMRVEPGSHTIGVLVPSTGKVHEKEITLSAGVRSINFGD